MKLDKIIYILFSVVSATIPFAFVFNVNSISIMVLAIFTLFFSIIERRGFSFIWQEGGLLILYFLFLSISILYSENAYVGFKKIGSLLAFILFPLIFMQLSKEITIKVLKSVIYSFVISNIVALFICYLFAIYTKDPLPLTKGSFYFTEIIDIHPTYFAMYLVFSFVLLIEYFNVKGKYYILKTVVKTTLLLIFVLSVFFLKSRSAILSLCVTILFYLFSFVLRFFKLRKNRSLIIYASVIAILFIIFFIRFDLIFTINDVFEKLINRNSLESLGVRFEIWKSTLYAVLESPYFGHGIGDKQIELERSYYINGFDEGIDEGYNAHNQFLESLLTGGLLLFSILFLLIRKLFIQYKKTYNKSIVVFIICLISAMSFESILVRQHGIVFFCFFFCLINKGLSWKNIN
ncbi:O-antigen ligase family protein [Aquimarina algiphila]|uniref:O-antigen ligase family protein n=3 Tax=Aquimarina algiphila TaxID=2047982 RepID=A0A554VG27_9FLAO|nr:O-antigen ligase family protein [Aquimarina algiphila]